MTDTTGWYARHLNGQAPPPPPPQQAPPPQAYQPPPPQYPQHQTYEGYGQQNIYPPQQHQQPVVPQINTVHDVVSAMGLWQGGEATRTETQRCPKCGGNHFFSRAQGARRGPPPAPSCFDCGYNAMFEQGDPSLYAGAG